MRLGGKVYSVQTGRIINAKPKTGPGDFLKCFDFCAQVMTRHSRDLTNPMQGAPGLANLRPIEGNASGSCFMSRSGEGEGGGFQESEITSAIYICVYIYMYVCMCVL